MPPKGSTADPFDVSSNGMNATFHQRITKALAEIVAHPISAPLAADLIAHDAGVPPTKKLKKNEKEDEP